MTFNCVNVFLNFGSKVTQLHKSSSQSIGQLLFHGFWENKFSYFSLLHDIVCHIYKQNSKINFGLIVSIVTNKLFWTIW